MTEAPRTPQLVPLWETLTFLSPLSETRADSLADWLAADLGEGTVVDIGCGWAELLLRVAARAPRCRALGVDLEPQRIARAREVSRRRGLEERVELVAGAGAGLDPRSAVDSEGVDAIVAAGASQVWGAPVEDGHPLDYAAALTALRRHLRPGGRAYFGEAVWSRPPTPEAVAALSGRTDEFVSLPDLLDLAVDAGFAVAGWAVSDEEEWDDFESGFTEPFARWLAAHAGSSAGSAAEVEEVRRRADRQRTAYLRGYRGVLGFAHLRLLAV